MEYKTKVSPAKEETRKKLREIFETSPHFVLTDYRGVTVDQITKLRSKLAEKGAHFHVIKNRLTRLVFHDLDIQGLDDYLKGPTAVAFLPPDVSSSVNDLVETGKETTLNLKAGYIAGSIFTAEDVTKIATLPSREVLLGMLCSAMNGGVRKFVLATNNIIQRVLFALQAIADKKK